MGCFGKNKGHIDEHAKWAYINLSDFHATSSWTPISYVTVWFFAFIGVAVFAVDCFTAINLLVLDRWASQLKPAIDLKYSKWIFVGCIMFSFALYAFEWIRAILVMRRGGIAESYMDPLAVQVQSMRGKGWKRFLVFASLTKSRKGADYVAFFVYFQFNSFLRIVFAEGGRQFVNAMTIVSLAKADLIPIGAHAAKAGTSPVLQFFTNIGTLYTKDLRQALILTSMAFTLAIWIFSALSLLTALVLYLVFLWHHIPQSDGRLSVYCRRLIDRRLEKIVEKKVQAGIEEGERKRQKQEARLAAGKEPKGGLLPQGPARQPTLPSIGLDDEKAGNVGLYRTNTGSTLPAYDSRPTTREGGSPTRQPTLPDFDTSITMPPRPYRQNSNVSSYSNQSYAPNASLLHNGAGMGFDSRPHSPMDGVPPVNRHMTGSPYGVRPGPARSMTNNSAMSQRTYGGSALGPRMPVRSETGFSTNDDRNPTRTGSAQGGPGYGPPRGQYFNDHMTIPEQPSRVQTPSSAYSNTSSQPKLVSRQSFNRPFMNQDRPSFDTRQTSQSSVSAFEDTIATRSSPPASTVGSYVAFNPYRRSPSAAPSQTPTPRRAATNPVEMQPLSPQSGPSARQAQRSATAPIGEHQGAYTTSPEMYQGRF